MFEYVEDNVRKVKEKINIAAKSSGRNIDEITLVAVSKRFPVDAIKAAVKYGITDIGESRIQESESKIGELGNIARWHLIGHLQTNKAKKAVPLFDLIQSLDSLKLAGELNQNAEKFDKKVDCLLEINSSGEKTKFGFESSQTLSEMEKIMRLKNIRLRGLMTIGPLSPDKEILRRAFAQTKKLFYKCRDMASESFTILSMGMSSDFDIAIEEGSNMIRVGTAIFGQRPAKIPLK